MVALDLFLGNIYMESSCSIILTHFGVLTPQIHGEYSGEMRIHIVSMVPEPDIRKYSWSEICL